LGKTNGYSQEFVEDLIEQVKGFGGYSSIFLYGSSHPIFPKSCALSKATRKPEAIVKAIAS
jgi:hypothetical protein